MKKSGFLSTVTLALVFNAAAISPAYAQRQRIEPKPARYAEIAVEEKSGKILYERNAQHQLYPASTTKLMTAYLTFQALKDGKLHLDDTLKVSQKAAFMPETNLWLSTQLMDKTVTVGKNGKKIVHYTKGAKRQDVFEIKAETALRGMLCHSANDAAVIFAEAVSGNTGDFVNEMNAQARRLGMHNTHFANTNGLPDVTNKTTVEDMAKLARALIEDFPEYYKFFSIRSIDYNGHHANNTNHLLGVDPDVDGMKTGWIQMSGFNLVASAKKGDVRVIAIVFGANTPDGRNADVEHLLQYAFQKEKNPKALFAYGPNLAANAGGRILPSTPQELHAPPPPPALVSVKPEEPKTAPVPPPEGGTKPDVVSAPPSVLAPKPPV